MGLSLIPAFGTLYQRLTLPESTRYENTKNTQNPESGDVIAETKEENQSDSNVEEVDDAEAPKKKAHFKEVLSYFSEWRHLRLIMGTASCWFFLDIAFYGINLNQNVVLQQIGFDGSSGDPWDRLFKIATGNIIITALGFVPGYYVTVLTIEKLGRRVIQIQGFLMTSLFREYSSCRRTAFANYTEMTSVAILAAKFHTLSKPAFIVLFALLQFFFNFGPNATTYVSSSRLLSEVGTNYWFFAVLPR